MRQILIIREALQYTRSLDGDEYYFLLKDLFNPNHARVLIVNAEIGKYLPPDYDLYIGHGKLAADAIGRLPPRKIKDSIVLSAPVRGAINTPLQDSWYKGRNNVGVPLDHWTLPKDVKSKIVKRSDEIFASKETPQLFHISFNSKLEGIWQPKTPDGIYTKEQRDQLISEQENETFEYTESSIYTETLDPRICLSDTIQGCFSAIYPNLVDVYRKGAEQKTALQFVVYYPLNFDERKMMDWQELRDTKQVWDAHLSREYVLFSPTMMIKYPMIIEIPALKKSIYLKCRPYDDQQYPLERHSPIIKHFWRLQNELD